MEWQPIETAPKDCTILVAIFDSAGDCFVYETTWWEVDIDGFRWAGIDEEGDYKVTHWAPIPKPPNYPRT